MSVAFLLASILKVVATSVCPSPLPCFCLSDLVIDCAMLSLDKVPQFLDFGGESGKFWEELNLTDNIMTSLPSQGFMGTKIKSLKLNRNALNSIHAAAFCGSEGVRSLDLSHNRLDHLTPGMFHCLPNLKSFKFQYNRVKKLTSETFSGSAELIALDLEGNELSTIPNSALRKLPKLRAMSLRNNRIHDVSPGAFSGVSSHLNYLDLGENGSPIVIRKHAFCGLDRPLPEQTAQQLHQHVALDGSQMKHSQQPQHPQLHTQQQHASDYPMNRKSAKHHKPHQNLTYIHRLHSQRRRPDLNIDISLVGIIYANEQREGLIELYLDHNGLRHFDMCLLRSLWTLEVLDLVANPLHCDCALVFIAKSSRPISSLLSSSSSVPVWQPSSPPLSLWSSFPTGQCQSPVEFAGQHLASFNRDLFYKHCNKFIQPNQHHHQPQQHQNSLDQQQQHQHLLGQQQQKHPTQRVMNQQIDLKQQQFDSINPAQSKFNNKNNVSVFYDQLNNINNNNINNNNINNNSINNNNIDYIDKHLADQQQQQHQTSHKQQNQTFSLSQKLQPSSDTTSKAIINHLNSNDNNKANTGDNSIKDINNNNINNNNINKNNINNNNINNNKINNNKINKNNINNININNNTDNRLTGNEISSNNPKTYSSRIINSNTYLQSSSNHNNSSHNNNSSSNIFSNNDYYNNEITNACVVTTKCSYPRKKMKNEASSLVVTKTTAMVIKLVSGLTTMITFLMW